MILVCYDFESLQILKISSMNIRRKRNIDNKILIIGGNPILSFTESKDMFFNKKQPNNNAPPNNNATNR